MTRDPSIPQRIEHDVKDLLSHMEGIGRVTIQVTAQQAAATGQMPMAGAGALRPVIRESRGSNIFIAIGSGKGGVGKSTVAVNLACAMAQMDRKIV